MPAQPIPKVLVVFVGVVDVELDELVEVLVTVLVIVTVLVLVTVVVVPEVLELQVIVKVALVEPVPPLGAFTVVLDGVMLQDQPDGAL